MTYPTVGATYVHKSTGRIFVLEDLTEHDEFVVYLNGLHTFATWHQRVTFDEFYEIFERV